MNTKRLLSALISLGVLALVATPAFGGGMSASQQSAAASAMGGAYTAIADTPAAGYFNPAGLATQTGLGLEVGGTITYAIGSYKGLAPGTGTETQVDGAAPYPLVNGHAAYRIHDRVAAGFSVSQPYGLGAGWPDTVDVNGVETAWWGRGAAKGFSIYVTSLSPNVAVKLHDRIYVGGGANIAKGVITLEQALTFSGDAKDDIDYKLSGEGWAVGGTAGILVKALPGLLNVGATYRSAMTFTLAGDIGYTQNGSSDLSPVLRTLAQDGPVEAEIPLPHTWSFGVAAFPIEGLTVAIGLDYEAWSRWKTLDINFPDNQDINVSNPRAWQNTITVRVGAEYKVLPYLPVRAGFIFEQGSVPAITRGPDAPDSDRFEGTAGVGYAIKGFRVDAAYMFRTTNGFVDAAEGAYLDGGFRLMMHAASLTLGYHLDI